MKDKKCKYRTTTCKGRRIQEIPSVRSS